MKSLIILVVFLAVSATAYVLNDRHSNTNDNDYDFDEEWVWVPDHIGQMQLLNKKEVEVLGKLTPRAPLVVTFQLYTRKNPDEPQFIFLNDSKSIQESNFNAENPTRIIIHGWRNDGVSKMTEYIRKQYLLKGDYNVIIVDWSSASMTFNYISARNAVPPTATIVTEFIEFLYDETKFSFDKLYLIGHSLGAHVCGIACKGLKSGRVNTIFALDPALPLFLLNQPQDRLNASDAEYVQVIHTNAGILGYDLPIGHASFYPNWGRIQPGCGFDPFNICSHGRSYEYFAESIEHEGAFQAIKCKDYMDVKEETCGNDGEVETIIMGGDPSRKDRRGIFYLVTNETYPFGLGNFINY